MATVLFLAPADLGETVLATGALDALLQPPAEAVVVCDAHAAPLFRALPALSALHVLERGDGLEWAGLWLQLLANNRPAFDHIVNARFSGWAEAFWGRGRAPGRTRLLRHRVEEWGAWLGAERTPAPKIWLDERSRGAAAALAPQTAPLLVIAPGGANAAKRWPAERFAAIARRLAGGPLADAAIVVLGAAERDRSITGGVVQSLAADGIAALNVGPDFDLLAAAALLERATLSIGNDNALTHIGAAVGAPTLTLFGPTDERVRSPWGPRARTLRGRPYEAIMSGSAPGGGDSLLSDVSVDAVEAAALDLLHAGGLR